MQIFYLHVSIPVYYTSKLQYSLKIDKIVGHFVMCIISNMSNILCRFVTYNHLMAFWRLIEPASHNMVRVTRARESTTRSEGGASGNAYVIIIFF